MITPSQIDAALAHIDAALDLFPDQDAPIGGLSRKSRTINIARRALISAGSELVAAKKMGE